MAFNLIQRLRTSRLNNGWSLEQYQYFLSRIEKRVKMERKLVEAIIQLENEASESITLSSILQTRKQELQSEYDSNWTRANEEDMEIVPES